jgi:hypothetical protein
MVKAGNHLMIVRSNPTSAHLWWRPCGVAWDAVPDPMVEYISPNFPISRLVLQA